MHKLFSCAQSQYSLDFGLFYLFVLHNLKSYPHVHNVFHRLAKFLPKVHPEYAIIWIRENDDKGGLLMENDVLSSLWETLLNGDQSIPKMSGCKKWLSQAVPRSLTEDTLLLDVMNDFTKEWIINNYKEPIEAFLKSQFNRPMTLDVEIRPDLANKEEDLFPGHGAAAPKAKEPLIPKKGPRQDFSSNLSPKYVFENFVIGNSNRFAHAASKAVAEAPAKVYNPLFLYSDSGLGKTHLMNAIGNKIHQDHPEMKILYTSSETFTNELINSIQNNATEAFRNKYRNIDVLLIDDSQFLRKKESTQEEFFHTFETLYKAEKQIIISSDRKPSELDTLEERLKSRFTWGLIADIQPPDLETRIAILKNMALKDHISVPDSVTNLIASNISTNIRELEGAYTKVRAYSQFSNEPITEELAIEALKDLNLTPVSRTITIEAIQQYIASYYNITLNDLLSKKRTANITLPRQIGMYLARTLTDLSLPRIGESFGGRDHTTVLHACDKILSKSKEKTEFAKEIEKHITHLKG